MARSPLVNAAADATAAATTAAAATATTAAATTTAAAAGTAAAASAMAAAGTPSHCQLPIEGYLKNIIIKLYMLICYRAPPSSVVRDQLSTV